MPCPRFQEGRPFHSASQQAPWRVRGPSQKSFTPTHMCGDLLIFAGCAVKRPKAKPAKYKYKQSTPQLEATEQKGNLLICDLWQNGTDSVYDMHVVNTDTKSYLERTPESVFKRQNGQRRRLTWRHTFSNVNMFRPSLPPLMGYWVWRRWLLWKGYPAASQQRGSSPDTKHDDTSRVGLPSLWYRPHTGASRSLGCQRTRSASDACSGKTATGSTCSGKRVVWSPDQVNPPPRPKILET